MLGVSTTFLFWGAMIRVTRNWAPPDEQGRAFGILEMGRGLAEVLSWMAFLALFAVLGASTFALASVVSAMSALCLVMAFLAWIVIEDDSGGDLRSASASKVGWREVAEVLRLPAVWLIAMVIFSAYCAMHGTVRFTSYVTDIFAMSIGVAGAISVAKMWLKPLAAPVAGFVADRFGIARSNASLLALLVACFLVFAILPGSARFIPLMLLNVAVVSLAVFALRGIYFALIEEGGVPLRVTGTAAGVISVIAYTPDIFMPLLGGHLLDNYPGGDGYRYFFLISAAICAAGALAAWLIYRYFSQPHQRAVADLR
jgi:nitrate/nitrite transporter NarK